MAHNVAVYLRLSHADDPEEGKDESNSISNQRSLIKRYLMLHPEFIDCNYVEFVDDGYTGTNTKRPAFQKMLRMVKSGDIDCIIVKDLSRFARDYILLGDYLEQIFPLIGIRFIAINDGYDSITSTSSIETMSVALKSLVYDYYSRDLSRKRSESALQRMRNGKIHGNGPYGYVLDREQNKFIIDLEAASVVSRIFSLTIKGVRPPQIANILNNDEIPTPAVYSRMHPEHRKATYRVTSSQPLWTNNSVLNILRNKAYTGCLIMHKTVTRFPGKKQRKNTSEEEQIIINNAHEAIITAEDFNAAQLALIHPSPDSKRQRHSVNHSVLTGKLICGHCGRTMIFRLPGNKALCPQYNLIGTHCPDTRYMTADIEQLVFTKLQEVFQNAVAVEKIEKMKVRTVQKELHTCRQKICTAESNLEANRKEKTSLYEEYVLGSITSDEYRQKKQHLNAASALLQDDLCQLTKQEKELSAVSFSEDVRHLASDAVALLQAPNLTREMVLSYVDSIVIYRPDEYIIHWRYSELFNELLTVPFIQNDKVEVPNV